MLTVYKMDKKIKKKKKKIEDGGSGVCVCVCVSVCVCACVRACERVCVCFVYVRACECARACKTCDGQLYIAHMTETVCVFSLPYSYNQVCVLTTCTGRLNSTPVDMARGASFPRFPFNV